MNIITTIFNAVFSVAALLLCSIPHEIAHGYTAYLLGDRTAKYMGRLSLNPLKHINPTYAGIILGGMFLARLLTFVPFIGTIADVLMWVGFVLLLKPVPINASNFTDPKKGMAITALMGPVTNLVLAFIACVIYRYTFTVPYLSDFLLILMSYNISLAVFNLIPVPPLDGSRVLFAFLPQRYYFQIMQYERYIVLGVFALIMLGVLDTPISLATGFLQQTILKICSSIFI